MKVLIMNPILYTSETDEIPKVKSIKDTMIYTLCRGFLKNGDTPVLLAADCYRPTKQEVYDFEIIWMPCKWKKLFKPRCLPLLWGAAKYLREHKREFDYIISSEVFSMLTLTGVLFAGEKLMIWHELGAHNNMLHKLPSILWYNLVARSFMRKIPVIPRSSRAETFIQKYCNCVKPMKIDHGVDLEKIACRREKDDYFVVVSQLIERKHIDEIIDRFLAFRSRGAENYRLFIVGDGNLREKLEQQVREADAEAYVQFSGKLGHDKLVPILNRARALLVNTTKDNSMVSIVESIAAGTPVVTTTVPFNADYIRQASLGIVKDGWGVEELRQICDRNEQYVNNCILYREKLSNCYCAKAFNEVGRALG